MATKKYLDSIGLSYLWDKIKKSFKPKQTAVVDPTPSTAVSTTFIDTISQDENGVITATKKTVPELSKTDSGTGNAVTNITVSGHNITVTKSESFKTKQTAVVNPTASGSGLTFIDTISQNENGEITVTSKNVDLSSLGNYLPLSGGTMTGATATIKRDMTSANSGSPFYSLKSTDVDAWLWRVSSANYSLSADYGFGLKYTGSDTGVNNRLRLYADNQINSQVIAVSINQSGQIGVGVDSDTSYRVKISGDTYTTNKFVSTGLLNVATGSTNRSKTILWNTSGTTTTLPDLISTSAIGNSSTPVYWNGSGFTSADAYSTLLTSASIGNNSSAATISVTVGGTTKTGSTTINYAKSATTLTNSPEILTSGNTVAVKAGEKTSNYITIPYATNAGTLDGTAKGDLLTDASLTSAASSTTVSVTVGGTTKTGSTTINYANSATTLTAKPDLLTSGNTIAVKAGGKTSDYITVPYATNAGTATTLTNAPSLLTSGNTVAVKAGEKTSGYITIPYATSAGTATTLTDAPEILTSGNTIAVNAGGKTSPYITVPYASNAGTLDGTAKGDLLTDASLSSSGSASTVSVTVGGTTKTGSTTINYANSATTLTSNPEILTSGTTVAIKAGEKTSGYITVPYATSANTATKLEKSIKLTLTGSVTGDTTFDWTSTALTLNTTTNHTVSVTATTTGNAVTSISQNGHGISYTLGSFKPVQTAVADPTASTAVTAITFIQSITQNENGVISPTRAYVSLPGLVGTSSIGGSTTPIYWTGSKFSACTPYSGATVLMANNLKGGAKGSIPYQTTANTTTFLSIGTEGQVLKVGSGGTPVWGTDNDTKNTAGSINSGSTKLFLIGAKTQDSNPITYSNSNVYIGTDNHLYSNGSKVLNATNYTDYVGSGNFYIKANSTTASTFNANQTGNTTIQITSGSTNGTISVGGTDVKVRGLKNAAYYDIATAVTNTDDTVPTTGAVYRYVDGAVAGSVKYKGGFNATNGVIDGGSDTLTSVENKEGDMYTCITAGTYCNVELEVGDSIIFKRHVNAGTAPVEADLTFVEKTVSVSADTSHTLAYGQDKKLATVEGVDITAILPQVNPSIQAGTANTSAVTVSGGGQTSSEFTIPYASSATTLTAKPDLLTSGNTVAVKAGDKTSDYITIPYASNAGTLDGTAKGSLLTDASLSSSGSATTVSVTVGGTTKTGSTTVNYANSATTLTAKPEILISGTTVAVKAGGKTSDYATIPYATSANTVPWSGVTSKPTIGDGNFYVKANSATASTFNANQTGNTTLTITSGSTSGTISVGGTDVKVRDINNSAYRDVATSVTSGGTALTTSQAVYNFVTGHTGNYLPLSGGTMTGAIKRNYDAASNDPMISLESNNIDAWLWRISHGSHVTASAYGFGLKYIATGDSVNNRLRLYADNQNGSQLIAVSINQNGQIGVKTDSDTAYTVNISGDTNSIGNIVPNSAATYSLGTSAKTWLNAWTRNVKSDTTLTLSSSGNTAINLQTSGATRVTVTSDGKVGIGITSPAQKLHVNDGLVAISSNGNRLTIGSQNTGYTHFENSADIPFWFNKSIWVRGDIMPYITSANVGSSTNYWNDGHITTLYTSGIYHKTSSSRSKTTFWNTSGGTSTLPDLISTSAIGTGTTPVYWTGSQFSACTPYSAATVSAATKWASARTITLSGSVTGSASVDGSGDVTISTTTNHDHTFVLGSTTITTNGNTYTGITGPFSITTNASENSAFTIQRTAANEGVKHWVDDSYYHIDYTNDEVSNGIKFRFINTDSESPHDPSQASDTAVYLTSTKSFYPDTNNTGSIGGSSVYWGYGYFRYGYLTDLYLRASVDTAATLNYILYTEATGSSIVKKAPIARLKTILNDEYVKKSGDTMYGSLTIGDTAHTTAGLVVSGATNLKGGLTVGVSTAVTASTTMYGTLNVKGTTTSQVVYPEGNGTYNLGDASHYWKNTYITNLYNSGTANITGNTQIIGTLDVSGATSLSKTGTTFTVGTTTNSAVTSTFYGSVNVSDYIKATGSTEVSGNTNLVKTGSTFNVGTTTNSAVTSTLNGTLNVKGTTTSQGVFPDTNGSRNLGDASHYWNNTYLTSLYLNTSADDSTAWNYIYYGVSGDTKVRKASITRARNQLIGVTTGKTGDTNKPIYWTGSQLSACTYNLNATVNSGSTGYAAYYSSNTGISHTTIEYFDTTNSRVGIGTTSPSAKLHVAGDSILGSKSQYYQRSTRGAIHHEFVGDDADYGAVKISHNATEGSGGPGAFTASLGVFDNRPNTISGAHQPTFYVNRAGATRVPDLMGIDMGGSRVFTVASTSKVGINTSAPSQALSVVGNVQVTNNTSNTGCVMVFNASEQCMEFQFA